MGRFHLKCPRCVGYRGQTSIFSHSEPENFLIFFPGPSGSELKMLKNDLVSTFSEMCPGKLLITRYRKVVKFKVSHILDFEHFGVSSLTHRGYLDRANSMKRRVLQNSDTDITLFLQFLQIPDFYFGRKY